MKVRELMSAEVEWCTPGTDLAEAAMTMWRSDCGVVPVVAPGSRKVMGVITDRDICMAAATTGRRLVERQVQDVMARTPFLVKPEDDVHDALALMEREHVRRLPVVDVGGALVGLLSINDLILATAPGRGKARVPVEDVMRTLRAISAHRRPAREEALVAGGS